MGLFDKVGSFLKKEAKDISEAADRARERLDSELTERERELEMTPTEKLQALERQGQETDDRFDKIVDKAQARASNAEAVAELAESGPRTVLDDLDPPTVKPTASDDPEAVTFQERVDDRETIQEADRPSVVDQVASAGQPEGPEPTSESTFDKTPAEVKYELAREAADELLSELRGELKNDGEI